MRPVDLRRIQYRDVRSRCGTDVVMAVLSQRGAISKFDRVKARLLNRPRGPGLAEQGVIEAPLPIARDASGMGAGVLGQSSAEFFLAVGAEKVGRDFTERFLG